MEEGIQVEYNLGRVDDILTAFNTIQEKQEKANDELSSLSAIFSTLSIKSVNQVGDLRTQAYIFSSDMGWLGVWDVATGNYTGFIHIGPSATGEVSVDRKSGNIFLLGENGNKIFIIDPYLCGVTVSLPFQSVGSFAVSPGGKSVFISQNNSSILAEVDASTGKTLRNYTLPGTALHLVVYPEAYLVYFSIAGTRAVYSVQHLSGEVLKVFDLPDDAVRMAPYQFGNDFGLQVLSGSGSTAAVTKWDRTTNTTSTVQVADAVEIVVNPYTGSYYVASLQNVLFMSLDGAIIKTVALGDKASRLTLTADGVHLIAIVSPGNNALIVDTVTGVVSTGPTVVYPPTQQSAKLLLAQTQFGFVSS